MDKREALKNMLNNIIKDNPEAAVLDFRAYLVPKMREVAGLNVQEVEGETEKADELADENSMVDDSGDTELAE